ncbi:hypothetical protein Ancab_019476 [Ancistrocladus abbreviatus]
MLRVDEIMQSHKMGWIKLADGILSSKHLKKLVVHQGTLSQNLYLESLAFTSATFASALGNLVPVITYILAISCRLEKLTLRSLSGKAKVAGTVIGIGGAMMMTLYKGVEIKLCSNNSHILKHGQTIRHSRDAKMGEKYPPYASTALMTVMGSIQAIVFALCIERDWKQWKLGWNIRLLSVSYLGIVGSGLMMALIAWCVRLRGPLFVSIFNPLALILVAIAGGFILNEKLFLGSVLGALLIICGLYMVLWGKGKEMKRANKLMPSNDTQEIEIITSTTDYVNDDQRKGNTLSILTRAPASQRS